MRALRHTDPIGFYASVVSHPGPLPLLLLARPGLVAVIGILLPIILRWLLALQIVRKFGRAPGTITPDPITLWVRELFYFAEWLTAIFVSHVQWGGKRIDLSGTRSTDPMTRAGMSRE